MQEFIGRTLGAYQIVEQIGIGGMATVYKAYQPSMDRFVAIKILPSHLTQDEGFAGRFTQEARTLARLEHPHILPVHDYGEQKGITYLVMRYVDAGTLKELVTREGAMNLGDAARILGQVGGALEYAHTQGVVHRDVKPSNVLIDQQGNTFLTDFGIAKLVAESAQFTASGAIIGTPAYMSPEQGMGQPADHRSDIYSLGVVLYEMVTGRVPFEAETPLAVMLKQINDPLPLPRQFRADVPESVERVILKATAKDPEHRYQSAQRMVDALDEAVAAQPEIVPPPTAATEGTTLVLPDSGDEPPSGALPPQVADTPLPAAPTSTPIPAAPGVIPPVEGDTAAQLSAGVTPAPGVGVGVETHKRTRWLPIAAAILLVAVLVIAGVVIVPNLIDGEPEPTSVGSAGAQPVTTDQVPAASAATEQPATGTQPSPDVSGEAPELADLPPGWTSYGNSNFVHALARQGDTLWTGGESGLVGWDLNDGSYTKLGIADGLTSSRIWDLQVDGAGDLWIATDSGINRYDGRSMTAFDEVDGLDSSHIQDLYLDESGGLWAGSRGGERGLNYFDGEAWGPPPVPPLPVDYRTIQAIEGSEEQGLFVGLDEQGLAYFDGEEWSLLTQEAGLPEGQILDLLLAGDSLWASFDSAVARLDLDTFEVENLPHDNIQTIHQAADGSLWFGGNWRALRYDPDSGDWQEFATTPGPIPSWMVTDIAEDEDRLWFGTYGGGLAAYDGSEWQTWTTDDELGGNFIEAIRQDSDGALWFTHPGSGMSRYQPGTGTWQVFGADEGVTDWPTEPGVDSDGSLWYGMFESLVRFDGQEWHVTRPAQLEGTEVYVVEFGPGDVQWLVTDRGLTRYDPATGKWTEFTSADHPVIGEIWSVLAASDGALWIGGGELARYDDAGWGTPEASGGAPRGVTGIAEAPDGSLWLAADGELAHLTEGQWQYHAWPSDGWLEHVAVAPDGSVWAGYEGLGRFDPATGEWVFFGTDDGLAHRLVRAIHVTPEGVVWVGTEGGVSRIVPPE